MVQNSMLLEYVQLLFHTEDMDLHEITRFESESQMHDLCL